jgi:DNA-binding Lrp family transcriptional regulator
VQTLFVQVKCERGRAYRVAADIIETVEGVSEVYSISGNYDLMLKCHLDPSIDVGHYVTEKIQNVPGVRDTFTIIAFKAFA